MLRQSILNSAEQQQADQALLTIIRGDVKNYHDRENQQRFEQSFRRSSTYTVLSDGEKVDENDEETFYRRQYEG